MNEEWLGTFYCMLACIGFSTVWLLLWNLVDKVEKLIADYKDRKNEWR